MKTIIRIIAAIALIGWAGTASASLINDEVFFEWHLQFPAGEFIYGPESAIVGNGPEYVEVLGSPVSIDIGDNYIEALLVEDILAEPLDTEYFFTSLNWFDKPNGYISNATITVFGLPADVYSVSFTRDSVTVVESGQVAPVFLPAGPFFRVDIEASHVPTPATLALLGLGLAGLGWSGRRRA